MQAAITVCTLQINVHTSDEQPIYSIANTQYYTFVIITTLQACQYDWITSGCTRMKTRSYLRRNVVDQNVKCDPLCRKVTFVGNHEILVIYIIVICVFLALIKCKLHHRSSNIARAIRHYFTRNVESIKDKFLRNSSLKIYSCSRFRVHGVRPEKKIDMCKPRPLTTDKSDTGTIVLVQRS